jgi:flavodoxin
MKMLMKKSRHMLAALMLLCMAMCLMACTPNAAKESSASSEPLSATAKEESSADHDALVIYFSATGTTKEVAEKIAALTHAELQEIIPADPYSDADLNYHDDQCRTSIEMNDASARPEISGEPISFDGYTTIYLGYPIWWGDAPRIMSTFVESHNFEGITVIPFCTSGGSDIGESSRHLAEQAGSGNWLAGKRFSSSVSEEELLEWIEELK